MATDGKPTSKGKTAKPPSFAKKPLESGYSGDLAERLRAKFAGRNVREVRMFGGQSFMIDGRMAVAAGPEGDLLVRIDPADYDELIQVPGAQAAIMGTDRPMGPGWIRVERAHLETADELNFWINRALDYHATQSNT